MQVNMASKTLSEKCCSTERVAKRYYEKEEYVTDAELYAKEVKESRVKLINKYIPLSNISNILELGCGSGVLRSIHPNWVGLDISSTALKRARPSSVIICDAQNIPIRNQVIDAIISFNTLEHVDNPERLLEECCRILSSGGLILSQESWFCEYARRPIPFLYKVTVVMRRAIRELRLLGIKVRKLEFTKLKPDLTRTGEDWDSVSSIDPHAMLCWLKSKRYSSLNEVKGMFRRCVKSMPFNNADEAIVVKKQ